jgi:putative oxidoreductase
MEFLDKFRPQVFAISRMVFGFMFAMHGLKNAFDMFGGPPPELPVAYFAVHLKTGLLPIQTHGEVAALYSWVFLMIAVVGDWKWAIDSHSDSAESQPQTES